MLEESREQETARPGSRTEQAPAEWTGEEADAGEEEGELTVAKKKAGKGSGKKGGAKKPC
jgi:hypothetical protein